MGRGRDTAAWLAGWFRLHRLTAVVPFLLLVPANVRKVSDMTVKRAWGVLFGVLLLSSAGTAQQPAAMEPQRFTAVASNISELTGAGVSSIDITITRFSDAAEEEMLMTALAEKGQDGLADALRRLPRVGNMRQPGQLAYDFHYARQTMERDGRRRIMMATDRPIGFRELIDRTLSLEYPFTLLDFRVDASGRGEGQLFLATKFIRSGNLLLLENLATRPVVISNIRPVQ